MRPSAYGAGSPSTVTSRPPLSSRNDEAPGCVQRNEIVASTPKSSVEVRSRWTTVWTSVSRTARSRASGSIRGTRPP